MRTHEYQSDSARDVWGRTRCVRCGLPKQNRVHDVPDRSEDDRSAEIIGEGKAETVGA